MAENKCRGCSRRYVGCHAVCDSYIKFKEEHDRRKEEILRDKRLNAGDYHFTDFSKRRRFG